eukprot:GDKI01006463.1.p1 GENE.GDKI01006463.1~~GDKI01006463.1.p1  ORF type:complete len:138 (-),score=34.24 GDKI01006463.1:314-727(-)
MVNWPSIAGTFICVYGIPLGLLCYSHHISNIPLEMFFKAPYTTDPSHTNIFVDWLGTACVCAGVMGYSAGKNRYRDTFFGLMLLFGVWSVQNLYVCGMQDVMHPFMYTHSVACLIATVLSIAAYKQLGDEPRTDKKD